MRPLFAWFAGLVLVGLPLLPLEAQQQAADKFRPQPLPAYPPGGLNASIYPLGWSEDGRLGLVVRWVNEASDEERWSAIFWSSELEEIEHNVLRVLLPPQDPMEAFDAFWALHGKACLEMAARHEIQLAEIPLQHFPYIDAKRKRMIEATLEVERGDSGEWGRRVVKRTTLRVTGSEPIVDRFEFPRTILALGLIGYLESPIPDRLMIIQGVVNMGWEGPPHPRSFRFVGVQAEASAFFSTLKGAEQRGRNAIDRKDFEGAAASLKVACRFYESRIGNHRSGGEAVPAELEEGLAGCRALLEEARFQVAGQHRAEGRYEQARQLLTTIAASAEGQRVDDAWQQLQELCVPAMYPPGARHDVEKIRQASDAFAKCREQLARVSLGSVQMKNLPLSEVLAFIESKAVEVGVDVSIEMFLPKKREQLIHLDSTEFETTLWAALEACAGQAYLELSYVDDSLQLVPVGEEFTRLFTVPTSFLEMWIEAPPGDKANEEVLASPRSDWGSDKLDPFIVALLSADGEFVAEPWWGSGVFLLSPDRKSLLVRHRAVRLKRVAAHLQRIVAAE